MPITKNNQEQLHMRQLFKSNVFLKSVIAGSLSLCLMSPVSASDRPSEEEASAFLMAASFGPTQDSIREVVNNGYSAWFRDQTRIRINTILSETNPTFADTSTFRWETIPRQVWFDRAVNGRDQLRQRAAWALSQIFVVSTESREVTFKSHLHASYMDIMQRGAFGNFRDILGDVTYSPLMGEWLTYIGNERENPETGSMPDENYAREIMQLFTIGLVELNNAGNPRNDPPRETYTQDDVIELSQVFTGLWWADLPFGEGETRIARRNIDIQPMVMHNAFHDRTPKTFLGTTIPGGIRGNASINRALDHLFAHRNVAPFISRQLIQRMTTSNPTNGYVRRVVRAFNTGNYTLPDGDEIGSGERGDMEAVFAAIIFDVQARRADRVDNEQFGKVREPLIRFLHWARASNINRVRVLSDSNFDRDGTTTTLGQNPYRAESVFNFFRPGFVAAGTTTADQGLLAPELQIVTSATAINYPNFMQEHVLRDNNANWNPRYNDQIRLANDPEALTEHLDLVMTGGRMTTRTKQAVRETIESVEIRGNARARDRQLRDRVQLAMLLTVNSQEYNTQQ